MGRWLILLAAILWSTNGFFAKSPYFDDLSPGDKATMMAFWRSAFASLVVVFLIRRWRWDWRLLAMGSSFAAMTWTFLSALVNTEASLAIWLQYMAPAWVVVLSWYLFREAPDRSSRWMLAFAMSGVAVILTGQFLELGRTADAWQDDLWGIIAGMLSGLFFAGVIVSLRRLRDFDSMQLVFVNQVVTTLALLPAVIWMGILPTGFQWGYLAMFGIVQLGTPYLLFAYGIKSVSSHEASGLGLLEPLLVPVWVYVAWSHLPDYEPPSAWTIAGGALILLGLGLQWYLRTRTPAGERGVRESTDPADAS